MCASDIFLALLAILFPPLPVWVKRSVCSADSLINIALCMLGYVPGLFHAWYIIAKYPESDEYDALPSGQAEEGRVTYYYVANIPRQQGPPPPGQERMDYGTLRSETHDGTGAEGAEGSQRREDDRAPPSYADVIKGDYKVQTTD